MPRVSRPLAASTLTVVLIVARHAGSPVRAVDAHVVGHAIDGRGHRGADPGAGHHHHAGHEDARAHDGARDGTEPDSAADG